MVNNLDERIVLRIREIGQLYPIERIVLFGSRARGDHRPTSDIDLTIFPLPGLNSRGHMISDLDELNTLLKIDTLIINQGVEPKIIDNILKEGVTLYERAGDKTP